MPLVASLVRPSSGRDSFNAATLVVRLLVLAQALVGVTEPAQAARRRPPPPRPVVVICDDNAPCYAETGTWFDVAPSADCYDGACRKTYQGVGADKATWSFILEKSGAYGVSAWWSSHCNFPDDALFRAFNNGALLGTFRANQRLKGGAFHLLDVLTLEAGAVSVELRRSSSGTALADAVRLGNVAFGLVSPPENFLSVSGSVVVAVRLAGYPVDHGVEFVLDGDPGSAVFDYSEPFEIAYAGLSAEEHFVEAHLVNSEGAREGISDVRSFGVGDYVLAVGDSITSGSGGSKRCSADLRNVDKGYPPKLNDLLTASRTVPHTIENEGIGGTRSVEGVGSIDAILAGHPAAQAVLIMYGTNDALIGQVASGLGLSAVDPGYAGSFKANMQAIIDSVAASGKEPALAKPPPLLGNHGLPTPPLAELNALLLEYGEVVDELAAENGILVVPPDMYEHFDSNPGEYSDDCHPNDTGYDSMAHLWCEAIVDDTCE
jgi:lysophospholipase L1-like esterase